MTIATEEEIDSAAVVVVETAGTTDVHRVTATTSTETAEAAAETANAEGPAPALDLDLAAGPAPVLNDDADDGARPAVDLTAELAAAVPAFAASIPQQHLQPPAP